MKAALLANGSGRLAPLSFDDALEIGPATWDSLALAAPFPSVFMSWAWHAAWYETAPRSQREDAFVLTDYKPGSGEAPQVLIPLGWRRLKLHRLFARELGWSAAEVGTPDHLDVLSHHDADVESLAAGILSLPWDRLVLTNLVENFPRAHTLMKALERHDCHAVINRLWHCAQLPLPSSWEAYLATLSSKRRRGVRKVEQDLRAKFDVELVDFSGARFEEGWSHLVRLHGERWEGAGSFSDERLSAMFRRFAELLSGQGRLGLQGLSLDGTVTAMDFWAEFGGTMFGIQSGRDLAWSRWSVGKVLRAMSLRHAIESGLRCADFSRGTDAYKREWCSQERWCYELRVFRGTLRGRVHAGMESLLGTARAVRRSLRPGAGEVEQEEVA